MNEAPSADDVNDMVQALTTQFSQAADGAHCVIVAGAALTMLRIVLDDLQNPEMTESMAGMLMQQAAQMRLASGAQVH